MIKDTKLCNLRNYYTSKEILMSFLTALLFFLLPGSLLGVLFANIVVLYIPYLLYLLLALYIGLVSISLFTNKVVIETLINYQNKSLEINYKVIYNKLVLISFAIITMAVVIGYLSYLSIN